MANAAKVGAFLLNRLKEIQTRQKTLGGARGLGLMCGIDVLDPQSGTPDAKRRNRIVTVAFDHGVIMLGCGEHTLRFCPALSITQEELDAALTLFEQAVASVA
jgi:4-aminobutyrate aminotransferase